ncbi:uncharacterized protein LACBIDRAFT_334104 [Laccaria bicolor S238N-H82]|uniref:Predicted protein n=1 Tax=Laccaria bicolor (strain S238N-H82 / ATCC MYA-4686) TaxID=486041 RepID=B0DY37_LACBS|nr:uncharacterized protein LACBIDRAFT_334104 [Laccaria bicolor S238N-H82]EDR00450.1 predicted protein [Laccaria bicolor S238N-H82]|eukprot:XP_001888842.1 predicted protein [Laccaria bicolor S238N-H82]
MPTPASIHPGLITRSLASALARSSSTGTRYTFCAPSGTDCQSCQIRFPLANIWHSDVVTLRANRDPHPRVIEKDKKPCRTSEQVAAKKDQKVLENINKAQKKENTIKNAAHLEDAMDKEDKLRLLEANHPPFNTQKKAAQSQSQRLTQAVPEDGNKQKAAQGPGASTSETTQKKPKKANDGLRNDWNAKSTSHDDEYCLLTESQPSHCHSVSAGSAMLTSGLRGDVPPSSGGEGSEADQVGVVGDDAVQVLSKDRSHLVPTTSFPSSFVPPSSSRHQFLTDAFGMHLLTKPTIDDLWAQAFPSFPLREEASLNHIVSKLPFYYLVYEDKEEGSSSGPVTKIATALHSEDNKPIGALVLTIQAENS